MPKVTRSKSKTNLQGFPLTHLSASSMRLAATNAILFKIKYINGDTIDSTSSPVLVLGSAFHCAMETYYGGSDTLVPSNEAEAIEYGLKTGLAYIDNYPDGFIGWNTTYQNKQQIQDKFVFAFNAYVHERPYAPDVLHSTEEKLEEKIDIEWRGKQLTLPVALKGYTDKIIKEDGKLIIVDYKTCSSFSDPEKIDGAKILQGVIYYFLVYAKYGVEPYAMRYEEIKMSKNRDGSPQVREYEMVYADNELFFDCFLRFYDDVISAINGKMVWLPNIDAMFNSDIALIAYINRLDVEEEKAARMKENNVTNITDLLKKEIANANNMRSFQKTLEKNFISAKSLDYSKMTNAEKIKTKLMEFGMLLDHEDTINGATVDLYRYTPSVGLKMSRVASYAADIQQVLGVDGVRILTPIPGTSFVGFEVPAAERTFPAMPKPLGGFKVAIGATPQGDAYRFDIREAPHMLVAGATGSGKSVWLGNLIRQLDTISNAEIVLCDPKKVELKEFAGMDKVVAHVTDHDAIALVLIELVDEMNKRYNTLAAAGVKNIGSYKGNDMPYKFVFIDEFGDITNGENKKLVNVALRGLAQMARAAGIHLILATQRTSVDVLSGTIRANFPTKVAFRVAKQVDSLVILDEAGAEKLLGKGDMLFSTEAGITRLQGYKE